MYGHLGSTKELKVLLRATFYSGFVETTMNAMVKLENP